MNQLDNYEALKNGAGLVDLSDRTQIELTGSDRAAFLHNLSTNDIRKLPNGRGCEAFFLNARGHILGYATIWAGAESHVIETVAGQGAFLAAHLDRYLIREKVEIVDRTGQWSEWFLGGEKARGVLEAVGVAAPAEVLTHSEASIAGCRVALRRVDFTPADGYLIACPVEQSNAVAEVLRGAGATMCNREAFETARIEAGTPAFGVDVTDKNLPQEVARDRRTISFTKGCYIGQETVARLDSLGHVNKLLVRMRFAGPEVPPAGCELSVDGKGVGNITSAAWSPLLGQVVALGYVRREHATPGTRLASVHGDVEVLAAT